MQIYSRCDWMWTGYSAVRWSNTIHKTIFWTIERFHFGTFYWSCEWIGWKFTFEMKIALWKWNHWQIKSIIKFECLHLICLSQFKHPGINSSLLRIRMMFATKFCNHSIFSGVSNDSCTIWTASLRSGKTMRMYTSFSFQILTSAYTCLFFGLISNLMVLPMFSKLPHESLFASVLTKSSNEIFRFFGAIGITKESRSLLLLVCDASLPFVSPKPESRLRNYVYQNQTSKHFENWKRVQSHWYKFIGQEYTHNPCRDCCWFRIWWVKFLKER